MRRPWPALGCSAIGKFSLSFYRPTQRAERFLESRRSLWKWGSVLLFMKQEYSSLISLESLLYHIIPLHTYHPISAISILILYSHLRRDIQRCSCCSLYVTTYSSHLNLLNLFQFRVSVHHIMINKNTNLMQLLSIYFTYSISLHVSGRILPIIRRIWYCTCQRLVLVR